MKIRVSELAYELRCKAREILIVLPGLGVEYTGAITHNTRLEAEDADKVRQYFASNPHLAEPKIDAVSLGIMKSIAGRFGEEI